MKKEKIIYFLSMMLSRLINLGKKPEKLNFQKILIIKLDEIGDVVNSLHVFYLLKNKYPKAEVTLLCKPFIGNLIKNDPSINKIVYTVADLESKYNLIADLRGNFETLKYEIKHPPDFRIDRARVRWNNKMKGGHPHEVETNFQILLPLKIDRSLNFELKLFPSDEDKFVAEEFMQKNELTNFILFHTGARRMLRRWSEKNFSRLALELKEKHKLDIIFVGDDSDVEVIKSIQKDFNFVTFSIAGKFTLLQFSALCNKAKLFIGNESGPLHIAAASSVPAVGLFGPGEPITFYPYGKKTTFIHHVLECNPCDQIHCVRPESPCIDLITQVEVMEKVVELIGN